MKHFEKGPENTPKPKVVDIERAKNDIRNREKAPEIAGKFEPTDSLFRAGNLLLDSKKSQKAKEVFTKITEMEPSYADAWNNLAVACEALFEKGEAIRNYQKAIECDPSFADAHFNLAPLLEGDKTMQAIHHYKEYLKYSNPDPEDNNRKEARKSIERLKKRITVK